MPTRTATVIGGGVMGSGIAQVLARRGAAVRVREPTEELVEAARGRILDGSYGLNDAVEGGYLTPGERDDAFDRIECTTDLEAAVDGTDVVIEAVTEDLATKGEVFRALDEVTDEQPLYSNTSGFSVTSIANAVSDPSRVAVMHFFNPVPVMSLVEIVHAPETDDSVVEYAESLVEDLGKTAITISDDPGSYGFVANRCYGALRREAERIVDAGIATEAQVDTALEAGYNLPVGPFSLRGIGEEWE